jgi:mono/diheme cytochrome c family protein
MRDPAIEFMRSPKVFPNSRAFAIRLPFAFALAVLSVFAIVRLCADDTLNKNDVVTRQQVAAAILEKHCVECHGGRLTRRGFDMTTRDGML